MKFIFLLLFIFLLQSCNTTKFELGKYCYRYPQGMFNSCLSLTTDSIFEFEFAGDMIHYVGQGAYKKLNRKGMQLTFTNPVISKRWDFEVKERIVYNNNTISAIVGVGPHIRRESPQTCLVYNFYKQNIGVWTSTSINCGYTLNQFPNATLNPCSNCVVGILGPDPGDSIDINEAMAIVDETLQYSYFPDGEQWINERELYTGLDDNPTLTASNSTLNNFYTDETPEPLGRIDEYYDIANDLSMLGETDQSLGEQRLAAAKVSANLINGIRSFEIYERVIALVELKLLEQGLAGLTAQELLDLQYIAELCPYIGGTAVFKARVLWANFEPIKVYDDVEICNYAGGANKNGKGLFDDHSASIDSIINNSNSSHFMNTHSSIKVYPNPTSQEVNVQYLLAPSANASFELFDVTGRKILSIKVPSIGNLITIDISKYNIGRYMYKFIVDNKIQQSGKLIIE